MMRASLETCAAGPRPTRPADRYRPAGSFAGSHRPGAGTRSARPGKTTRSCLGSLLVLALLGAAALYGTHQCMKLPVSSWLAAIEKIPPAAPYWDIDEPFGPRAVLEIHQRYCAENGEPYRIVEITENDGRLAVGLDLRFTPPSQAWLADQARHWHNAMLMLAHTEEVRDQHFLPPRVRISLYTYVDIDRLIRWGEYRTESGWTPQEGATRLLP